MSRSDRILVAAGGCAAILVAAAVAVLALPATGGAASAAPSAVALGLAQTAAPAATTRAGTIVVDVEGAVAEPGVRELSPGSRIADAIAAAGGYASDVDLAATAAGVNLAQPLTDGQQVVIPRLGEAVAGAAPSQAHGAEGAPAGGLVNLNTATPEELEDLPGIGAVTVQKIVAAREERPFTSLEDAVERGVIHRGQLEDLQGIATAG